MKLSKELITVTPFSKTIALLLFIIFPILAFIFGTNYQKIIDNRVMIIPTPTEGISCTLDAKICPDGSSVGRILPDCEFAPCPKITQSDNEKIFCGGITGKICPAEYYCQYDGTYPDAGGTCVKEKMTTEFSCPINEYVDCMPGPDKNRNIECGSEFLQWAQENCPNFKGAAY